MLTSVAEMKKNYGAVTLSNGLGAFLAHNDIIDDLVNFYGELKDMNTTKAKSKRKAEAFPAPKKNSDPILATCPRKERESPPRL